MTRRLGVGAVAVAGDYAALVNASIDPITTAAPATRSLSSTCEPGPRLPTAAANRRSCPDYAGHGCSSGVDQLVLGTDAATAAHTFVINNRLDLPVMSRRLSRSSPTTAPARTSSTASPPQAPHSPTPASLLSQLALSGHTLTWSHAGTPESAQLN